MADKELIKQEIERLKHTDIAYDRSRFMLLLQIEDFINSLPKEPANEDLEEAATKWNETASFQPFYMQLDCNGNPCEVKQDITTHKESFKAGAEWQKQKDLEDLFKSDMTMPNKFYEKGKFDMREEIMKDAVEGVIDIRKWPAKAQVEFYDRLPVFNVRTGDKVKIIIVKPEQL